MADLDVSDVLDDPDFNSTFSVWRAVADPQSDGTTQPLPAWIEADGVVIPDGGLDLIQVAEGNHVAGDLTIYTRLDLTAGTDERAADRVSVLGVQHKVISAQSYAFGSGYTRAICKLVDTNPSEFGETGSDDGGYLDQH